MFAVEEIVEELCPWCIVDGSAAALFDAQFTDVGWGVPDDVPAEELAQLAERTPGFSGWQQEHWLYHCGGPAAFLGRVGYEQLKQHPDAMESLLRENDEFGWTPEQARRYVEGLRSDGDATGYLFRCISCGAHLAYSDMS